MLSQEPELRLRAELRHRRINEVDARRVGPGGRHEEQTEQAGKDAHESENQLRSGIKWPSRTIWMRRPVTVGSSWSGSMPKSVYREKARSSGVTGRSVTKAPS